MPFESLRVIADSCSFIIDCFNTGERGEGRVLYNDAVVKCCVDGTLNAASNTHSYILMRASEAQRWRLAERRKKKVCLSHSASPSSNCPAGLKQTFANVAKSLKEKPTNSVSISREEVNKLISRRKKNWAELIGIGQLFVAIFHSVWRPKQRNPFGSI